MPAPKIGFPTRHAPVTPNQCSTQASQNSATQPAGFHRISGTPSGSSGVSQLEQSSVRKWDAGERTVPGPVSLALTDMLREAGAGELARRIAQGPLAE